MENLFAYKMELPRHHFGPRCVDSFQPRDGSDQSSEPLTLEQRLSFNSSRDMLFSQLNSDNEKQISDAILAIRDFTQHYEDSNVIAAFIDSKLLPEVLALNDIPREILTNIYYIVEYLSESSPQIIFQAICQGALIYILENIEKLAASTSEILTQPSLLEDSKQIIAELSTDSDILALALFKMAQSSFICRALIFSTGVFNRFADILNHRLLHQIEYAASLLLQSFIENGPYEGFKESENDFQKFPSPEFAESFFSPFARSPYFSKELYNSFCQEGTFITPQSAFLQIFKYLLCSDDESSMLTVIHSLSFYIYATKRTEVLGETLFFAQFERISDIDNEAILTELFRLIAIYLNSKGFMDNSRKELIESTIERGIKSDKEKVKRFALTALEEYLSYYPGSVVRIYNSEFIDVIRNILYLAKLKTRKMALSVLFLIATYGTVDAIAEDNVMDSISFIIEEGDSHYNLYILQQLSILFKAEEKKSRDGISLLRMFEHSGGVDKVFTLLNSDDKELSEQANMFLDRFYNMGEAHEEEEYR